MKKDIEEYVKGCAFCQENKINTHQLKLCLVSITTNTEAEPFEVITIDFIVKLPLSKGYNTILTITDHDCSKVAIFIPCNETITVEGVVNFISKNTVYCQAFYWCPAGKQCKLHKFTSQI